MVSQKGGWGGGGLNASLWWRDMEVLRREEWFQDRVQRVVGNGDNTLFWADVWGWRSVVSCQVL